VSLVPDEGAVQDLAAASADPAFGYRVHAGRPYITEHGPDPGISENRAERGREVRAAVADHKLDLARLLVKVQEEVAGLLGGPFPSRMQSDSQDADAPAGVLDHGQDVGLGAVEQVDREEVATRGSRWPENAGTATNWARSAGVRGRSPPSSRSPIPSTPLPSHPGQPVRRGSGGSPIRDSPGPAGGPGPGCSGGCRARNESLCGRYAAWYYSVLVDHAAEHPPSLNQQVQWRAGLAFLASGGR
jgi:hypothetical protein